MDRAVINADFVLWTAPLKMGFPAELLKRANDKHLPLIHPYIVIDQGEAHHLKRYSRYPRLGLLIEKEADTDAIDLQIICDIYKRTALNFKTRLEFMLTTETPVKEILDRITSTTVEVLPLPKGLTPSQGTTVTPPARLTLFNGSPRGHKGNTPILLNQIASGFGGPFEIHHLVQMKETEKMVDAFVRAECVLLGTPLYTDAMPAIVKYFIEALEPLVGRDNNPAIGFVVQSGFPEALHSRYLERYLEKLAHRLGSPYLGTVVKGGGEATRVVPPEGNKRLFENLQAVGVCLAKEGRFDPDLLRRLAHPERFSRFMGPIFKVFLRLTIANSYFDNMLKDNGAFESRFAQPFLEE
jgi:hypothetical protein